MQRLILFILFLPLYTIAQDCGNYLHLQPNKVFEMQITNKKGKIVGKQIYQVKDVKTSGSRISSNVDCEMVNEKGKSMSSSKMKMECNGGVLAMDMSIFIPEEQGKQFQNAKADAEQVYLEYPLSMKAGQSLKEGNMVVNIDNNGLKQSLTVLITDRMVESEEKITTPAGTWNSFKITSKTLLTMETIGIPIKFNLEGTEWFVPGMGTVKTQSKHGVSELLSIQ